jgi:hypothetical protein
MSAHDLRGSYGKVQTSLSAGQRLRAARRSCPLGCIPSSRRKAPPGGALFNADCATDSCLGVRETRIPCADKEDKETRRLMQGSGWAAENFRSKVSEIPGPVQVLAMCDKECC